jgi:serine protease Do
MRDGVGSTALLSSLVDFGALAERVRASVVQVRTSGVGAGAGTIWRADGLIATNHHVVPGERAEVWLDDGRRFEARTVGRDVENDLALLAVSAEGLPTLELGDARRMRAGELVLAVGNPFGLRAAVAMGVLSVALVEPNGVRIRELVRSDVQLEPGYSGGPLVDAHGRLIGLNAMVSGGMALTVPTHLVERLVATRAAEPAPIQACA